MNERLLENLSDQAMVDTRYINSVSGSHVSQWKKRFAELIVLECAGVTLDYKNDDHYTGWCDHSAEILEHFGMSN